MNIFSDITPAPPQTLGMKPIVRGTHWAFFKRENNKYIEDDIYWPSVDKFLEWNSKNTNEFLSGGRDDGSAGTVKSGQNLVCLDLEAWHTTASKISKEAAQEIKDDLVEEGFLEADYDINDIISSEAAEAMLEQVLDKLKSVVDYVHGKAPNVRCGFYRLLPTSSYWTAKNYLYYKDKPNHPRHKVKMEEYERWLIGNDKKMDLAQKVDVVFPCLYDWYDHGTDIWEGYVDLSLREARKYNKKIYPYVCPRYLAGSRDWLTHDRWLHHLNYLKNHELVDGIVIWYSKTIGAWSTSLPWWEATKDFMGASSNIPNSSGNPFG
jgi:hypothetical protein